MASTKSDRSIKIKFKGLVKGTTERGLGTKEISTILQQVESNDSNFTKLVITKVMLKGKAIQSLATALASNVVITHITLSGCGIEDKGNFLKIPRNFN